MTALHLSPRPAAPVQVDLPRGIVSVHVLGFGNATAWCSCGWTGRRRLLKAVAMQDAWAHSARDRCEVSTPLLLTW
ncbi:hypothetical protein MMAD_29560 [Mycolicibacterium madagascariense]|uniref:Uncharacterized protein n=1 Tax=Mycolicibacterium madagascariense TaxID=212765 RepID=A0A7I7XHJ2_9MYCO|nr:hypothetical protein [Mycolicibacterium madagascariense]MCV7011554.1 hypothetical protein [Mycolicibacterium madagascariense]BBZ28661.1 hypothetical protein MMAD_29560 [Mycolicibacterium madagascariense]